MEIVYNIIKWISVPDIEDLEKRVQEVIVRMVVFAALLIGLQAIIRDLIIFDSAEQDLLTFLVLRAVFVIVILVLINLVSKGYSKKVGKYFIYTIVILEFIAIPLFNSNLSEDFLLGTLLILPLAAIVMSNKGYVIVISLQTISYLSGVLVYSPNSNAFDYISDYLEIIIIHFMFVMLIRFLRQALKDVEVQKEVSARDRDSLDLILQSVGDGVIAMDADYNVSLINGSALSMLNKTRHEVIGKEFSEVIHLKNSKTKKNMTHILKEKVMGERKVLYLKDDLALGREGMEDLPISDSAAPIINRKDEVIGCVVVFSDATADRHQDELKREFISLASHQLRTPITSIKWYLELIEELDRIKDPEVKKYFDQIVASANSMNSIIETLLSTSRFESEKLEYKPSMVSLREIIDESISENKGVAETALVSIDLEYMIEADEVEIDKQKIKEAIKNLINNAIKYSQTDSQVKVRVQDYSENEIKIEVQDSGIGIPKHQQIKIFDKFFRAENAQDKIPNGNGLGLYLVKSFVEAHGGTVSFESEEGKGTTFNVILPRQFSVAAKN